MMKLKYSLVLAFIIAITFSSLINKKNGSLDNIKFHLNLYDKKKEVAAVESAIKQYNKNSASFYNSAGFLAGLDEIPAAPFLKRRLFKDINMLKGDGLVMVFDKDSVTIRRVYFKNRLYSVAETREIWAISLQDIVRREPVFNLKAVEVNVRYQLYKEKGRWIAYEVDVYPKDEQATEIDMKAVL